MFLTDALCHSLRGRGNDDHLELVLLNQFYGFFCFRFTNKHKTIRYRVVVEVVLKLKWRIRFDEARGRIKHHVESKRRGI